MKIRQLFNEAKQNNKTLFIPYITCGDPNLQLTEQLVFELTQRGADIIELGVPFTDPLADGITNQLAAQRALQHNVSLLDCCKLIRRVRQQHCYTPIVLFTYFNPILQFGVHKFAALAREVEIDAVLILDLPVEEAKEVNQILTAHQIGSIFLVTPTTTIERLHYACQFSPEFFYYVARTGVTGVRRDLPTTLADKLQKIRQYTNIPIAVGFGISTLEHAAIVKQVADGIVVGSALVKQFEDSDIEVGKTGLLRLAAEFANVIRG